MLTTTMAQPKTMQLLMPRSDGDSMALPAKKALTIILGPDNRIAWYEGSGGDAAPVQHSSFSNKKGIRDVIIDKKEKVQRFYHKNELMILIKADRKANYSNLVDIMDEMLINKIDRYAVVDITPEEQRYFE